MGSCCAHIYARLRRKWSHTWEKKPQSRKDRKYIRGKKPQVYCVIILKQMADHNFAAF